MWMIVIIVIIIIIIIVLITTKVMYNKTICNADMRLSFFWDVTQRILKGQAVREGLLWTALPLKVGKIVCPETTRDNNQHKLRNIPEVRRPQIFCDGTLKYRLMQTSQSPLLCTVSCSTKRACIVCLPR